MPYEIPELAGKPYRPSNGVEGVLFCDRFCGECVNEDEERDCKILTLTLIHDGSDPEFPAEWTHDDRGRPTCTAFERRG